MTLDEQIAAIARLCACDAYECQYKRAAARLALTRSALQAMVDSCPCRSFVKELRAAAGKVTCWKCGGSGTAHAERRGILTDIPCPDCAELRELQAVVNSYPNHKEGCVCSFCCDAFDDARRVLEVTK